MILLDEKNIGVFSKGFLLVKCRRKLSIKINYDRNGYELMNKIEIYELILI